MFPRALSRIVAVVLFGCAMPGVSAAANKEHQQMMAELRMLQEQTQLLQTYMISLTDALRLVTAKLDEQAGANRKNFADQKLLIDTISNDVRVVREKVDDSNVRISSLSQEIEAIRLVVPSGPGAASAPVSGESPNRPAAAPGGQGQPQVPAANPGVSPQRLYDQAWADYVGSQYNLAVAGFQNYIRTYPKSEQAGSAQYYIGESYYQQGMFKDAVGAYERGISDYPNGKLLPDMYYKQGMALNALGQTDRARESWDLVVKTYPNSDAGRLAKQRLDQMNRKDDEPGLEEPAP